MKKYIFSMLMVVLLCVFCKATEEINQLELNSLSVYMINLDNNRVMLSKNADKFMEPASLTKIMTTLVVLENCKDIEKETIHISDGTLFDAIHREGGSNISLRQGETLTVKDLLYATMLPSACDAAELLAYHFGNGNIESFVSMMNARANEIGAKDTVFKNAHGLNAQGHITTAYDMYLIAREALRNDQFREIISASNYTIPATQMSAQRNIKYSVELVNRNSSNFYRYASGIKTGFTDEAGRCLVTMATRDGASYLLVLLGANLDGISTPIKTYSDATTLFEYVFNTYSMVEVAKKGELIAESSLCFSQKNQKPISILAKEDMNILLPHDVSADMLEKEYSYNADISLPILKNDTLGYVKYLYNGQELASFEIVSGTEIYDTMPAEGNMEFYSAKGFNRITLYKALLITGVIVCAFAIIAVLNTKKRKIRARRLPPSRKRNVNK